MTAAIIAKQKLINICNFLLFKSFPGLPLCRWVKRKLLEQSNRMNLNLSLNSAHKKMINTYVG